MDADKSNRLPLEILYRIGSFCSANTLRRLLLVGDVGGVVARRFLLNKLELNLQELREFRDTFKVKDIIDSLRHLSLVHRHTRLTTSQALDEELLWIGEWSGLQCLQLHGYYLNAISFSTMFNSLRVLRSLGLSYTHMTGALSLTEPYPPLQEVNLYSIRDSSASHLLRLPTVHTIRTDGYITARHEMNSLTSVTIDYRQHGTTANYTPIPFALGNIANTSQIQELVVDSFGMLQPEDVIDLPSLRVFRGDIDTFLHLRDTTTIETVEFPCKTASTLR